MTPTTRKITLYWLLLLLPTLLAGVGAFYLLRREQARIAEQASVAELARRSAIESRAQLVAENVALLVDDVQRGLLETLRALPAKTLDASLAEWEATNPLVRTTFISRPDGELLRPKSNGSATDEGREFSRRFSRLLKVVPPWNAAMAPDRAAPVAAASLPADAVAQAQPQPMAAAPTNVKEALATREPAPTAPVFSPRAEDKAQADTNGLSVLNADNARQNFMQIQNTRDEARALANRKIASLEAPAKSESASATPSGASSSYFSKSKSSAKKPAAETSSSYANSGASLKTSLVDERTASANYAGTDLAPAGATSLDEIAPRFRYGQNGANASDLKRQAELEQTKAQALGALAEAKKLLEPEPLKVDPVAHFDLAGAPAKKLAEAPAVVGSPLVGGPRSTPGAPTGSSTSDGPTNFPQSEPSAVEEPELVGPDRSGWVPWFADNSLHLLGWMQPSGTGKVRGLEIELNALIARMGGLLPLDTISGVTFGLRDDAGRVLHTTGEPLARTEQRPQVRIALTEALPHWEVVAWFGEPSGRYEQGAAGFFVVGSLLIGILLVAILAGGSLLLWQARRSEAEAVQKTTFVANVSHEFKTPLTTIRMYSELLAQGRVRDEAKQADYLQTIGRETQRLARLVGNVLDFSRLEQGRKKFQIEPVNLTALVTRVAEEQRPRLAEAGMELELVLPDAAAEVATDRDAVEQVLLNLLDNAAKYAAQGGSVQIELKKAAGGWIVRVADRGPGVPLAQREKIFEKFHRVDDTLTAEKGGAGLGLSIAQQLARGLGGDLRYEARSGGGAVFVLSFKA